MSVSAAATPFHNVLLDRRFLVELQIGKGSFGVVYQAKDLIAGKMVAIKFESKSSTNAQLPNEYSVSQLGGTALMFTLRSTHRLIVSRLLGSVPHPIAKAYKKLDTGVGIPKFVAYGSTGNFNYLAMEMLGPTLEKMFNYCNRHFSLKTVLMIGDAMLRRLEWMHQMSLVHRDIKPENMAIDYYNGHELYLLDFGLATPYCSAVGPSLCQHIKMKQGTTFTGTVRYSSINALERRSTSRRDDIESLAYVLIYFLKGRLPWQQIGKPVHATPAAAKQRKERVLEMKMAISAEELCDGLPMELIYFLNHCRGLGFEEKPNYAYLRRLLG